MRKPLITVKSAVYASVIAILLSLGVTVSAFANDDQKEINHILKMKTPPFGVVFEIVEGDAEALEWAIPQIKKFSKQLKEKFPEIGIAVVSHGSEQFGLMKSEAKENEEVHTKVKSLVKDDIPVHVCGTHASWLGKSAKDFPDYIDVTPAGPTQIRNYEDMGYELIVMDEPEEK